MIPGLEDIFKCSPVSSKACPNPVASRLPGATDFKTLGDFLTPLFNIVFYIAIFLAFYFLIWGAFAYILAQGKKEDLAKARARITWAIMGLLITLLAFFVAKFGAQIFPPGRGGLPF